MVIVQCCAAWC